MAEKMQLQGLSDEILTEKVNVLERMKLKGLDTIKEFSDEMLKWDPRIVSVAVKSAAAWRDWIAADQQQQQQQQQQR
ncbi:MAG: hypothetical protein OIN88_14505 [Candidatus Methanoperedens sp.]|nr:hypothetical protein [Candidatus Methanoperedens sp.]